MKVYVDIHDRRWGKYKIDFEKIANAVVGTKYKNAEVSIILVDDAEIHEINKTYRGMDKPTNVLSFELGDDVLLGDIYISLDTVLREAREAKISVTDHVAHMVVHGVLHLLGYDHIDDDQAIVMEMKEIQILKKIGIKNPYDDVACDVCVGTQCCPGGRIALMLSRLKVRDNSWLQYVLYALFGGIASFGFAPFYQWWWTLLGVGGAYWLTVSNKNIGGFVRSWLRVAPFGAMYSVAMFWWVLHSIYVVPELTAQFAIWTVPGVIGLAMAGAVIFSWPFVAVAQKKLNPFGRVILFACVWVLVLWAREWMFTGFPWNPVANITMPVPVIANSMALWGALGLSFIVVAIIASVVEVLRNRKSVGAWAAFIFAFVMLCTGGAVGYANMQYTDTGVDSDMPIVRIVQPAVSQSQKATHSRTQMLENAERNLRHMLALALTPGEFDIIIFPETAYPFAVRPDDRLDIAQMLGRPVIVGATTIDSGNLYNSMVMAGANGEIQQIYSKSHLVPFGEYRPLGFLPASVDLTPGNGAEIIDVEGFVFAPAICYEVVFSNSLVPDDAGGLFAIVNITNDTWFGNTPGVYQHLDMVRRYAIESGLPIVRANYSGISAFVAADGSIMSSLPVGESGVLDGMVFGAHMTPYRAIGLNHWMIIILLVSIVGLVAFGKEK